jgi:hypothetical protein
MCGAQVADASSRMTDDCSLMGLTLHTLVFEHAEHA